MALADVLALSLNPSNLDDLLDLNREVNSDDTLRGASSLMSEGVDQGELGAIADVISVVLPPGALAALAPVLISWIRNRRTDVSIKMRREDGTEVELSANKVKLADASDLAQLAQSTVENLEKKP